MDTYSIKVAYNGAPFCGFAKQPGLPTVQGEIESALALLFRRDVETVCAGRTDSGVHARGQIVSFDIAPDEFRGRSFHTLCKSMNALTADGISVVSWDRRNQGFSARFDAKHREYRYFFSVEETTPIFTEPFSWHTGELDIDSMQKASRYLLGEKDFKSFCMAISAKDRPTCRNVMEISFYESVIMEERTAVMKIIGNAFLHSMVRAIAGTLVTVGKGRRSPEWVRDVLAARNRSAAGETAPAKGLVFWDVAY